MKGSNAGFWSKRRKEIVAYPVDSSIPALADTGYRED